MATEPGLPPVTRRQCLQRLGLGAGAAWLPAGACSAPRWPTAAVLAACWDDPKGLHQAGWLRVVSSAAGAALQVQHATELPTRGHGLAPLPDGRLLVVARRPGDWLVRLSPTQRPHWVWVEAGRQFSGHVLAGSGTPVFTPEIDTDTGQGLLGVRHPHNLEKRAEFSTHGPDPHAVLAMPVHGPGGAGRGRAHPLAGMLFVANGGIDAAPETGRTKHHLHRMDSSVVCLHPATGELLGQWRLPDPRLSLRHLAWAHTPEGLPVLGIALQAEHDDDATRAAAPLLAVLDWQHNPQGELRLATDQPALAGYGGDVALLGQGEGAHFVVSATRGHALAHYTLAAQYRGQTPWAEAGALSKGHTVWAGGREGGTRVDGGATPGAVTRFKTGRVDNHWLLA